MLRRAAEVTLPLESHDSNSAERRNLSTVRKFLRPIRAYTRAALASSDVGREILLMYYGQSPRATPRNEVARLTNAVGADSGTTVRIVYDNRVSPPTYGDLFIVIMLGRWLALEGRGVEFVIVDTPERRGDWDDLNRNQQEAFVQDQVGLARSLLPANTSVHLVHSLGEPENPHAREHQFTLYEDHVSRSQPIYNLAPRLLRELARSRRLELPLGYLLSPETIDAQAQTAKHRQRYIAWHIRKAHWEAARDSTDSDIESDFVQLRTLFPHHDIVILSSAEGIRHAIEVLSRTELMSAQRDTNTQVFGQPQSGFLAAVSWAAAADFYFQRRGGGVGAVPTFTSVPYLQVSGDPQGLGIWGCRRGKLVPWAAPDQVFAFRPNPADSPQIAALLNEPLRRRIEQLAKPSSV